MVQRQDSNVRVTLIRSRPLIQETENAWTLNQTFHTNVLRIYNPAATFVYRFQTSAILADRIITLPLLTADDTIVVLTLAQTLTNKTLTTPVVNSPTGIVKGDVGLGNVDNTSDATKNAATATLTNKTLSSPVVNTPTGIVKGDVGLGNVDNTSDATKNAATATLTNKTLTSPVVNTPTGIVKGDVGLGNVDNTSDATKNAATATLTNKTLTSPVVNTPTGIVKGDVGLGNVDDTSDATKNAATATLTNKTLTAPIIAQVVFPATQDPSAGANALDDYEEGTWTPVLTFATPGNLNVVYSTQLGRYIKIGQMVCCTFQITTTTFTHTTASGFAQITGLPFTSLNVAIERPGTCAYQGITKATYTDLTLRLTANSALLTLAMGGSGLGLQVIETTDMPTGGTVTIRGSIVYRATA